MKSWKKPTPEEVDKALTLLITPELLTYFFEKLENPEWVLPLKERGIFSEPSQPKKDVSTITYPPWPQSKYLARMASKAPKIVLETILGIPETDNIYIHEDFIEAALNMPPELASRIAEKEADWIKKQEHLFGLYPEKAGKLIIYLLENGRRKEALALTRQLFEIFSAPEKTKRLGGRIPLGEYDEVLNKCAPILAEKAGLEALYLFTDLLQKALKFSKGSREYQPGKLEDYSYIWKPFLETNARDNDLKDFLVNAVRKTAEIISKNNPEKIQELVNYLESKKYVVFYRISLHILRLHADKVPELVGQRLIDPFFQDDFRLRREYVLLLKENFSKLPQDNQEKVLKWITKGPDVEAFKETFMEIEGRFPTEEEIKKYEEVYLRDRLSYIKDSLPQEWQEKYRELVKKYGEPKHPELPVRVESGFVRQKSPKTEEELSQMSVEEIVDFLKTWRPTERFSINLEQVSMEGLSDELYKVIKNEPIRFANEAEKFEGVDPIYIRKFLKALKDSIKEGKSFDWKPVLSLCHWVASQPKEIPERKIYEPMLDKDWGWTRFAILELLNSGLSEETTNGIPVELKDKIWEIIKPLTEDPDPSLEEEPKKIGPSFDPILTAINSIRPRAIEMVIQYLLWLKRNELLKNIDNVPEVKQVLEIHLNIEKDPSLSVRAMYGRWMPWLFNIDKDWASSLINKIFPSNNELYWEVAWGSYLVSNQPYNLMLEFLRKEYEKAINKLGIWENEVDFPLPPDERLAEHLVAFYWRGKLDLKDPLFKNLWENASEDLRFHIIEFIGRNLKYTEGDVLPEILGRLKTLWEWRVEQNLEGSKEYKAFGFWFSSGKFDKRWAIEQLLKAINLGKGIEDSRGTAEELTAYVGDFPYEVAKFLDRILDFHGEDYWVVYGIKDKAKEILKELFQGEVQEVKNLAVNVINKFGSLGFFDFGELLDGEN